MRALGEQRGRRGKWFVSGGLGDDEGVGRNAANGAQVGDGARDKILMVGRVEEDQAGGFARWRCEDIDGEDGRAVLGAAGRDIGAQGGEGGAVVLDEGGACGAARQGFQAERARARKDVEDMGAVDRIAASPGGM